MDPRCNSYDCLCGDAIGEKIAKARVLVVGAGGIGCEILKNLVLSGFHCDHGGEDWFLDIKLIDFDTIEMSNLNRQFLFRREHIGQSKALVAASVVRLPSTSLTQRWSPLATTWQSRRSTPISWIPSLTSSSSSPSTSYSMHSTM